MRAASFSWFPSSWTDHRTGELKNASGQDRDGVIFTAMLAGLASNPAHAELGPAELVNRARTLTDATHVELDRAFSDRNTSGSSGAAGTWGA